MNTRAKQVFVRSASFNGNEEERTSLTGSVELVAEQIEAAETVSSKRKTPPLPTGSRFKVVGHMVLAMQRFQASLNPTVEFGKRPSASGQSAAPGSSSANISSSAGVKVVHSSDATSEPRRGPTAANAAKLQKRTFSERGHIADLVFSPLPPVEVSQPC